jgi:putative inorganic carbon (HCO3(-)) transporter
MGHRHPADFEPVAPARRNRAHADADAHADAGWLPPREREDVDDSPRAPFSRTFQDDIDRSDMDTTFNASHVARRSSLSTLSGNHVAGSPAPSNNAVAASAKFDRRAHALSFAGLFLFTFVLYFRPYELIPALSGVSSMALIVAVPTLVFFFFTQFTREGNLTARPREVNLVLLFVAAALLSIPLAINRGEAWGEFNDKFIKAVLMFIVMVNVVRTERRLRWLLWLSLAISCFLAAHAVADYRAGRLGDLGVRVAGVVGGMFGNPNDMALHLVTMVPIAVALFFTTRNPLSKFIYAACAALIVAGVVVSFSRGGFLGLIAACGVLAWKLGRKHKLLVGVSVLFAAAAFVLLAPGDYGARLGTITSVSADLTGSSSQRQALLIRSLVVTAQHPLFGVGMGNFHIVSIHELVSHNAFTQVSAEMGIAALVIYVWFMAAPLRRLRSIERETFDARRASRFYYLAVGLQAALVGYMVSSFFASVAYSFYVYYLVGYAVALRRLYEAERAEETARATNASFNEASHADADEFDDGDRATTHDGAESYA